MTDRQSRPAQAGGQPGAVRQLSWSDRLRGALLGGAVGDALGAGVRGWSSSAIRQWLGPRGVVDNLPVFGNRGGVTDLTQLTVFTMDALLRARATGEQDPLPVIRANHLAWLYTQGVPWPYAMSGYWRSHPEPTGWLLGRSELFSTRNAGGPALRTLSALTDRVPAEQLTPGQPSAVPPEEQPFADCLVWTAPVMVWSGEARTVNAVASRVPGLLTSHYETRAACALHSDVLGALINGIPLWDAVRSWELHRSQLEQGVPPAGVLRTLHAAVFTARQGGPVDPRVLDIEFCPSNGLGELGIAFASVASAATFADAVTAAVNHSADSSIAGALAGQLAGAIHGAAAIPERWAAELEIREIVNTLSTDAAEAFAPPPPTPKWAQRYVDDSAERARGLDSPAWTVDAAAPPTQVLPAIGKEHQPPPEPAVGSEPAARAENDAGDPAAESATARPPVRGTDPGTDRIVLRGNPEHSPAPEHPPDSEHLPGSEATASSEHVPESPWQEPSGASAGSGGSGPVGDIADIDRPESTPVPSVDEGVADSTDPLARGYLAPSREEHPAASDTSHGETASPEESGDGSGERADPFASQDAETSAAPRIRLPGVDQLPPLPGSRTTGAPPAETASPELSSVLDSSPDVPWPPETDRSVRPSTAESVDEAGATDREGAPEVSEPSDGPFVTPPTPARDGSGVDESVRQPSAGRENPGDSDPVVDAETDHPWPEPATWGADATTAAPGQGVDLGQGTGDGPGEQPVEYVPDIPVEYPAEPVEYPAEPAEPLAEPPVEGDDSSIESTHRASGDASATEAQSSGTHVGGGHAIAEDADAAPRSLTERILGCLLGGALGDALGAGLTPLSAEEIADRHGAAGPADLPEYAGAPGSVTAATQTVLFSTEGLIRACTGHSDSPDAVDPLPESRLAAQRWLYSQGVSWRWALGGLADDHPEPDGWLVEVPELFAVRSPGSAVYSELEAFGERSAHGEQTAPVDNSTGCGALVRATPAAFWSAEPVEVFEVGVRLASLTHGHPSGYLPAGAFAVIVQQAVLGKGLDEGVWLALQVLETWQGHEDTSAALATAVDVAAEGTPDPERLARRLGGGRSAAEVLAIAVCATLASEDVRGALRVAVRHSGNSSASGAVCGSIVGALLGVGALPMDWLAELELREVVQRMAMDCVAAFDARLRPEENSDASSPASDGEWRRRYPSRIVGEGEVGSARPGQRSSSEESSGAFAEPDVPGEPPAPAPEAGRRDGSSPLPGTERAFDGPATSAAREPDSDAVASPEARAVHTGALGAPEEHDPADVDNAERRVPEEPELVAELSEAPAATGSDERVAFDTPVPVEPSDSWFETGRASSPGTGSGGSTGWTEPGEPEAGFDAGAFGSNAPEGGETVDHFPGSDDVRRTHVIPAVSDGAGHPDVSARPAAAGHIDGPGDSEATGYPDVPGHPGAVVRDGTVPDDGDSESAVAAPRRTGAAPGGGPDRGVDLGPETRPEPEGRAAGSHEAEPRPRAGRGDQGVGGEQSHHPKPAPRRINSVSSGQLDVLDDS
ncbi:ADP-ribosylglycohydrolase [Actinopolyspora alba]|uniref:ADP-ribosylglycohydrolase n=1 Tax=Actinopolyspora alba TaxID=673379 RepID=A0A1I1W8T7_9ACTN|nr:ADP-ribosylglycohydrolase family protein [Actinopolyspora alba]SFD91615.1 ADP-ribosylglycohydrolase [Actinopolyspora alba]